MAASSAADVPDAYRTYELRAGLLRLASPPCDGELTLIIDRTEQGIAVSRVRYSSENADQYPTFPLDGPYQATVAAFLARVVAELDTLADLAAQWRETERKETWNAKVY